MNDTITWIVLSVIINAIFGGSKMTEKNANPQNPPSIPEGFTARMLDAMPRFVVGIVGTFMGVSLSFVIVLKLGGMDVAFSRVVNAYAQGLETQMTKVAVSADRLTDLSTELTGLVATVSTKVDNLEARIGGLENRQTLAEASIDDILKKTNALATWACDHERLVGKRAEFGATTCNN